MVASGATPTGRVIAKASRDGGRMVAVDDVGAAAGAGLQTHRLRREKDRLRIRARRVDLTSCEAAVEVIEVFI